jgi:hypothetical protein
MDAGTVLGAMVSEIHRMSGEVRTMAARKPKNAKEALERLSKHYGLNRDDWYQLHQNWILKHAAVQKMAMMSSIDGHRIEISPIQSAVHDGVCAEEVVMNATFSLVDSDGKVAYASEMFGEANTKNTKIPYPWAMAHKRLHDRGVLLVLELAQFHIHSDVEVDEWKDKAPPPSEKKEEEVVVVERQKPEPRAKRPRAGGNGTRMPRRGVPVPSVPASVTPTRPPAPSPSQKPPGRPLAASPEPTTVYGGDPAEAIMDLFRGPNAIESVGKKTIMEMTGLSKWVTGSTLKDLIAVRRLEKTGRTKGIRYGLPGLHGEKLEEAGAAFMESIGAPPVDTRKAVVPDDGPPLTMEDWSKAQARLQEIGGDIVNISRIVAEMTGHPTPYMAIQSGALTRGAMERVEQAILADRA